MIFLKILRAAAGAALLAGLAGCEGMGGFNLVSRSEEQQMGDQLAGELQKKETIIRDPQAQAFLDAMGQKIAAQTQRDLPGQRYTFYLAKSDQVNAFAIPGGHCYVYSALVEHAENEAEVAAVVAHEISHVVARHGTQSLSRAAIVETAIGATFGEAGGGGAGMGRVAANLFAAGGLLHFSRTDELEADRRGVNYMNGAGYDPQAMATFFRKLIALRKSGNSALEQFFSTHPATEDRIAAIEALVARLPQRSRTLNTAGFARFKERVGWLAR